MADQVKIERGRDRQRTLVEQLDTRSGWFQGRHGDQLLVAHAKALAGRGQHPDDFTQTGQTYDVIFDAVGKSSFSRCKGALTNGGIYLSTAATLGIVFQTLWTSKFGNKRAIVAFTGLRPAREKAKDLRFLEGLVESGAMRAVIDRRYPLERTAEAHRYVDTGHKKGSVVVTVQ